MSADDPKNPKHQQPPRSRRGEQDRSGIKVTLPMGSVPVVPTPPGVEFNPESSATKQMQSATFPPERWGKERDLVSSASAPRAHRRDSTSGTVTLTGERMPENLARELLNRRFAQYDYELVEDYSFRHHDTVVVLDGFDPGRRVGYQYISHADQDVVTDHDAATSETLRQLEEEGLARILVIHDGEVITGDALIELVDAFLATPSPG